MIRIKNLQRESDLGTLQGVLIRLLQILLTNDLDRLGLICIMMEHGAALKDKVDVPDITELY